MVGDRDYSGRFAARADRPVSGLVLTGLIERMGLQPQAMRVALHRLKRDGWIDSFKKGRVGYYTLSPMAAEQVVQVSDAIYGRTLPPPMDPVLAVLDPRTEAEDLDRLEKAGSALILNRRTVVLPRRQVPQTALVCQMDTATPPDWMQATVAEAARLPDYAALLTRAEGFLADLRQPRSSPVPVLDRTAQRMLVLHGWRRLVLRSNPVAVALAGPVPQRCRDAVLSVLQDVPRPTMSDLEIAQEQGR